MCLKSTAVRVSSDLYRDEHGVPHGVTEHQTRLRRSWCLWVRKTLGEQGTRRRTWGENRTRWGPGINIEHEGGPGVNIEQEVVLRAKRRTVLCFFAYKRRLCRWYSPMIVEYQFRRCHSVNRWLRYGLPVVNCWEKWIVLGKYLFLWPWNWINSWVKNIINLGYSENNCFRNKIVHKLRNILIELNCFLAFVWI